MPAGPPPTFLYDLFYQNLPATTPYPATQLHSQTVIVTGSNTGLGLEAARHIARLNCGHLILAVRSVSCGEAARESILASTKRAPDTVSVWELDQTSFKSVRMFMERAAALPRLDAVVLSAGVATRTWERTKDGWERTLQVNVLSTALLALRLLPTLVASGRVHTDAPTPRLVVVSSEVHFWTDLGATVRNAPSSLAVLNDEVYFRRPGIAEERYSVSKVLDVFLTRELAELVLREAPGKVVVNTVNPGLCHSELGRDNELGWGFWAMKAVFARTTEKGSRTLVDAATRGVDSHGQYLSNSSVQP